MNIYRTLEKYAFRFSKKYGQNFIGDENLLDAIVSDAGITDGDTVLEIGAGAGTLTKAIAARAKRTVAFGIDRSLEPVLNDTLYGADNCEIIFADIMDYPPEKLDEIAGGKFKVTANLPYYITTPVIFRLLECKNLISATVMVQKEVAQRICAAADTPEYGALSVAVQTVSSPEIKRIVGRNSFTPPPGVDSAIVRMDVARRTDIENKETFDMLVRAAFAMRRKTFVNNLVSHAGMNKTQAAELLAAAGFSPMIRGEAISVDGFVKLSNALFETENGKNRT